MRQLLALFTVLCLLVWGTPIRAQTSQYQVHAGDQLAVQVYGDSTLTQTVTVLPDGSIEYPLIGQVSVSGLTPAGVEKALKQRLTKYVKHPVVTVMIAQQGQPNVLVLGNVKTPGKYTLRSGARLTDAIAAAGGLGEVDGLLPNARVSDGTQQIETVSLQKLLHDGDTALDLPVQEGTVVYIPGPMQFDVEVVGAVDHPGQIVLNQGDRLSMAIAKAGNSATAQADLNNIRLVRTLADGKSATYKINLYRALEQGQSNYDVALQKGDVIYVPQTSQRIHENGLTAFFLLLSRIL